MSAPAALRRLAAVALLVVVLCGNTACGVKGRPRPPAAGAPSVETSTTAARQGADGRGPAVHARM